MHLHNSGLASLLVRNFPQDCASDCISVLCLTELRAGESAGAHGGHPGAGAGLDARPWALRTPLLHPRRRPVPSLPPHGASCLAAPSLLLFSPSLQRWTLVRNQSAAWRNPDNRLLLQAALGHLRAVKQLLRLGCATAWPLGREFPCPPYITVPALSGDKAQTRSVSPSHTQNSQC